MLLRKILKTVRGRSKKDAFYGFLLHLLGRKPRKIELYRLAFRHRSASLYEGRKKLNNERLEYLGDAILGAIVADMLFSEYPNQKEGFLTKLRSRIVSRKSLNKLGKSLHFDKHIIFNGAVADNILGDCVEALVGAIYLDFGYKKTQQIVEKRFIRQYINIESLLQKDENYKSKLLEWTQSAKEELEFITDEQQKGKRPYFYTTVLVGGEEKGKGEGFSKKQSQQIAAKKALGALK